MAVVVVVGIKKHGVSSEFLSLGLDAVQSPIRSNIPAHTPTSVSTALGGLCKYDCAQAIAYALSLHRQEEIRVQSKKHSRRKVLELARWKGETRCETR